MLQLSGGRTVDSLTDLRAALAADRTAVEQEHNDQETALALAVLRQQALLARLGQVRDHALNYWTGVAGQGIAAAVPDVPGDSAQWTRIETALDDIADL